MSDKEVTMILFQDQVDLLYNLVRSQAYFLDEYRDLEIILDLYRSRS